MSNDDLNNEFDTDDFDTEGFDDGGFDDLNDKTGTLGDLWRNNPLVKVGVILAAFAFLVGGIILFGGKEDRNPTSRMITGRDITEAPGSAEVNENYRQALEEENVRRAEEAIRQSESTVPMPIGEPKGALPLQFEEPEEEDPLERWRRMQEDRIRQQQVEAEVPPEPEEEEPYVDTRTPAINALAAAMSQQMESVLSNQQIKGPILQQVAAIDYLEDLAEKERRLREEAQERLNQQLQTLEEDGQINILLPAGSIEYAQLITEANTDAPGPILAEIATGPLRGARAIGSFTSTDDYLTLNFNTVILDGIDYPAQAVAIDPNTTLPGVVTDIDRRYFQRIILPTAAEFVTGLTDAIANSGTTTIVVNNSDGSSTTTSTGTRDDEQEVASGIAEAGEAFAEILDEEVASIQPLLRVRAGTPIGLLFVTPVLDTPQSTLQGQQATTRPATTNTTTTLPPATTIESIAGPIDFVTP